MVITNSPDLGVLEVKVSFDLSGVNPVINLTNQTTANPNVSPTPTLGDLIWVLNIFSPTGTPILQTDWDNPWKTGVWTTEQITNQWPRPFGNIEWGEYQVQFQVKDSIGNIYELDKSGNLCRPVGNTKKASNTYGVVALTVDILCERASLYLKDNTSKTYQGIVGVLSSGYLAVDYPRDPTGTIPDPFVITSFSTDALVPFSYNGRGYDATTYSIYTYDLGDNVFVVIRYTAQITFDVQCNIDLCPLACAVKGLEDEIKGGKCDDVMAAQNKLNIITPMLLRAFIAKANPACGIDLAALVDEIKTIGGFNCDCVNGSTGIGSQSALIDGLLFSVNNEGGDIVASFEVTGNNVVLNVKDRSYTFGKQGVCLTGQSENILLVPTVGATNTHVCLQVNNGGLAEDIYNATASDNNLLNLFNSLFIGGFTLTVDGKCVINNGACAYSFTLDNIPASTTNAILVAIQSTVDANTRPAINYAFNRSTLAALQTYLNTLGIGVFTVTNPSGSTVLITTTSNAFALSGLVYTPTGASKKFATFTSDCSGLVGLTPSQIVQAIIDYLCGLTDAQVITSQDYTICYIDPESKTSKTVVVDAGTPVTDFIIELLARGCDTISYVMNITGLTCSAIQALFASSPALIQDNDILLGTKGGDCARIAPVELGTRIFEMGIYNPAFMSALAAAIALNAGGKMCEPFTLFNLSTVAHSPADNLMSLVVTFTHPSAISANIRYARVDQGGDLNWSIPVNVLIGASPKTFTNVDEGQYIVGITPVYADGRLCSEISKYTTVCGSINAFSAVLSGTNIVVSYNATSGCSKVRVVITYPNGGSFSQIYTNNGVDITIAVPALLYGFFYVTMEPVCNEANGWFGPATAPAIVEVTEPNNSTVTNNTVSPVTNVQLTTYSTSGSKLVLSSGSIAASGGVVNFFVPDGFYTQIIIVLLGTSFAASLATDSGSYVAVGGVFSNVTVNNGIAISLIDTSPA